MQGSANKVKLKKFFDLTFHNLKKYLYRISSKFSKINYL